MSVSANSLRWLLKWRACPVTGSSKAIIARISEVFPLVCPICGGHMRIIAFITHSADIRQSLHHIGVDSELPHIAVARGPPLWDMCDAQAGEGSQIESD